MAFLELVGYTDFMNWKLAFGVMVILAGLGVGGWLVFGRSAKTPASDTPAAGGWVKLSGDCYIPVNNPKTPAPGRPCLDPKAEITFCDYEGSQYGIGEKFAAVDGCNTCICSEETRDVVCTQKICPADASTP